eukprot:566420-Pyramimonas_sp.AAC.1
MVLLPVLAVQQLLFEHMKSAEKHAAALDPARYRAMLTPLLKVLRLREVRKQLVSTLAAMAAGVDASLAAVMPLVADMNAFSTTDIDGLDYERRLGAYRQVPH